MSASESAKRSIAPGLTGPPPAAAKLPREIHDVWSRTASKYRTRAIVLLLVNLLLYAGLGCFAFWIRTGVAFAPAIPEYWPTFAETFSFTKNTEHNLGDLLSRPISVEEVPMQIVILGLMLAAIVAIPIVVAILYRFPASLPFVAIVAFLAMMPWLAITLTGACILASVRPFRFRSRFASALMGLVLVIIYCYLASRRASEPVDVLEYPSARIKLIAPWILAIVASCLLVGIVLVISHVVNYRPGAIAPLLALMFALPVGLFEFHVGRDELYYRLLEEKYGPGSAYFADVNVTPEFEDLLGRDWSGRPEPKPSRGDIVSTHELLWLLKLAEYGDEVAQAVQDFIHSYPESRHVCSALYLKGRALDMRIDQISFREESNRQVRFYGKGAMAFPSRRSRDAWTRIIYNEPDSSTAAVALLRLALLDIREGQTDSAMARLTTLVERFSGQGIAGNVKGSALQSVLSPAPKEAKLAISIDNTVFEGRRLLDLLSKNKDPRYGFEPLTELFRCDPTAVTYGDNLLDILNRYPKALVQDNIELELAMSSRSMNERIERLKECAARHPTGDALAETYFRLAEADHEVDDLAGAMRTYTLLCKDYPESIWCKPAQERLRVLPADAVATTPGTAAP